MQKFDIVIIGSGPGGYVAAIRAAQLGKKVAIVEKSSIGGTCLNVGCIPSKTYLNYSDNIKKIRQVNKWGIETGEITINFAKLLERKNHIVKMLNGGVQQLLKKNDISLFEGEAYVEKNLIKIGTKKIRAEDILLATGSMPFVPSIDGLDQVDYDTTDTFFDREELPKKLVVIGGGTIAVEVATAMAEMGTEVTMVEVASDILSTEETDIRKMLKKNLERIGVEVITSAQIKKVENSNVVLADKNLLFDRLLVATGRKPNNKIVNALELKKDSQKKFVIVNHHYETSQKNVYAIGDLIGGYQLAHVASAEGIAAIHAITGEKDEKIIQENIPRCIYTSPEAASFGLTEIEAKDVGYDVSVARLDLATNSKAMTMGETEGFLKIIIDKKYHEILGAFMVGPDATEQISTILAVKQSEGTAHELADIIQPHPSLSEIIGEGANALFDKAIHI